MKRNIVIFDMDGTLIDSAQDITISINYVRRTINLEPLSKQFVVDAINSPEGNLPFLFYGTQTYEPSHKALFETHYHEQCIQNVRLYEDIELLLIELKARQVHCSVATNAPAPFARRMLGHLQVAHHFDYILGADSYRSKPHPDMLHTILSNYGYDLARDFVPLMVGDNAKDIQAGTNAGMKALHVTWGFAHLEHDLRIRTPLELLDYLDMH